MAIKKVLGLIGVVFVLQGCQSMPSNRSLEFALLGDNPYQNYNFPKYKRMIEDINAHGDLAWAIHLGDFKDGGTSCEDAAYHEILAIHEAYEMPLVLTPGDNDWFDCKRKAAGGFDRLERLQKVRELFYSEKVALPVVSQASSGEFEGYVENVYWVRDDVLYATVHTVGITGREGGIDINAAVNEAAVAWLDVVFKKAVNMNARGVFIATQADIYPFSGEMSWLKQICENCFRVRPMYEEIDAALVRHTRTFSNPVVLAVGDTHLFRIDKPLYDGKQLVTHFTRVEPFGESEVHWVRVVVDPDSREVFSFHQEIIPENLGTGWRESDKQD